MTFSYNHDQTPRENAQGNKGIGMDNNVREAIIGVLGLPLGTCSDFMGFRMLQIYLLDPNIRFWVV